MICIKAVGLYLADLLYLLLPLAAGFMFLGPLAAICFYDVSRRIEKGQPVSIPAVATAWRGNFSQIAGMGLMLMLFMLSWIRLAALIFALFTAGGLATAYLGLIVTLPLLGHASWHAYRDLIGDAGSDRERVTVQSMGKGD